MVLISAPLWSKKLFMSQNGQFLIYEKNISWWFICVIGRPWANATISAVPPPFWLSLFTETYCTYLGHIFPLGSNNSTKTQSCSLEACVASTTTCWAPLNVLCEITLWSQSWVSEHLSMLFCLHCLWNVEMLVPMHLMLIHLFTLFKFTLSSHFCRFIPDEQKENHSLILGIYCCFLGG